MLDVNGNIQSRDAFIIYSPEAGSLRGELYHASTFLGLRTITADPIKILTDNTQRAEFTADGIFNVNAKTNLLDTATALVMSDADSSNRVETTGRVKRLLGAFSASNGVVKVGNDFQLGGTLTGNTAIALNNLDLNLSGTGRLLVDTGRIVVGVQVDPLYPLSVKKVYDNITEANFLSTVAKYPLYADKDVRFTQDSMSMWGVPGDNAGLSILRYKAQSILNLQNNVNRFTAHHSVLALEKYPGFGDTTIFQGRVSPLTGITAPTGFAGIISMSQGGLTSTNPNLAKGWFSAIAAEYQLGGGSFNKLENAIWLHAGILGNTPAAGSIDNGYGLYINGFSSVVTNKYSIYQQGSLDTNYFAGKIRFAGLAGTGTRIPTLSSTGVAGALTNGTDGQVLTLVGGSPAWATAGGSGIVLAAGSVPYGTGTGVTEDNSNFYFDPTNKRLGIAAGTSPVARLHINTDALGGTTTGTSLNSSGIFLSSTTAATNGAQQMSPAIVMRGNGYGTTGAASQTVDWKMQVLPIQGTTPSAQLVFSPSINGATYTSPINFTSGGMINAGTLVTTGAIVSGAASFMGWQGRSTMYSPTNGNIRITNQAGTDFGLLIFGDATSSFPALQRSGTGLIARLGDNSADAPFAASGLTLSGLTGTGTRLSTTSSTGVSGIITNGSDGQVMTMVSGSPTWSAPANLTGGPVKVGMHIVNDADYTIGANDYVILYSSITTARTLTLPSAASNTNRMLIIKHSGDGPTAITLSTSIRESPTVTSTTIPQGFSYGLVSDGTDWWIIWVSNG